MTLRERIPEQSHASIQAMRQRVQALYRQGSAFAQGDNVLSSAFEELALALEQLQSAEQALHREQTKWLNRQAELELQCQRYKDLFVHAPAGYLVTSIDAAIRQANPAALALLQVSDRAVIGRALALFVPEGQRRAFRNRLTALLAADQAQEWVASMRSWEGVPFEARLTAGVVCGASGRPIALHWLIRALDEPAAE
jgi:PAS domain S-box-containing protein